MRQDWPKRRLWGEEGARRFGRIARLPLVLVYLLVWFAVPLGQAMEGQRPSNVGLALTDELGPVFVNEAGFTLYSWWYYDDKKYKSNCNNDRYERVLGRGQAVNMLPNPETRPTCEQAWPPLRPTGEEARVGYSAGDWQVIERHDGSLQWSYQGKAVYLSSYDREPGQLMGYGQYFQGRNARLGRTPLFAPFDVPVGMDGRMNGNAGITLTSADGYTLYSTSVECDRECEKTWRPFNAPMALVLENGNGRWSFVIRKDGSRQWAYNGEALYTYTGDLSPGDANGKDSSGWSAVHLHPQLSPPKDITVQVTGDGEVFADRDGKTLYAFYCFDEAPDHLSCDVPGSADTYRLSVCGTPENCLATWQPVVASKGAETVGQTWTIVGIDPSGKQLFAPEDGSVAPLLVWAYRGRPVFTYAHDQSPGDILGDNVGHQNEWGFWMVRK